MEKKNASKAIIVGMPRGKVGTKIWSRKMLAITKKLTNTEKKPIVCKSSSGLFEKEAIPRSAMEGEPILKLYLVSPALREGRL